MIFVGKKAQKLKKTRISYLTARASELPEDFQRYIHARAHTHTHTFISMHQFYIWCKCVFVVYFRPTSLRCPQIPY